MQHRPLSVFNHLQSTPKENAMQVKSIAKAVAALALTAAATTPAFAETILETSTGVGMNTPLHIPLGDGNWFLGVQNILIDGQPFQAYCADPAQYSPTVPPGQTYAPTTLTGAFGVARATDVESLYAHFFTNSVRSDNTLSAAFQLALWELANDDGNTSTGSVRKIAGTNATVVTDANWFISVAKATPQAFGYAITVHTNGTYQDYITAVPEPETYAMFLAGLGMMGFVARRRSQRA